MRPSPLHNQTNIHTSLQVALDEESPLPGFVEDSKQTFSDIPNVQNSADSSISTTAGSSSKNIIPDINVALSPRSLHLKSNLNQFFPASSTPSIYLFTGKEPREGTSTRTSTKDVHLPSLKSGISTSDSSRSIITDTEFSKVTLLFGDAQLEKDYRFYFAIRFLRSWRIFMILFGVIAVLYYIRYLITYPSATASYAHQVAIRAIAPSQLASNCPIGYYCSECSWKFPCITNYSVVPDIILISTMAILPIATFLTLTFSSWGLSRNVGVYWSRIFSACMLFLYPFGFLLRAAIVEPTQSFIEISFPASLTVMTMVAFLRIPFLHTVVVNGILVVIHIVFSFLVLQSTVGGTQFYIAQILFFCACSITCVTAYENEKYIRQTFLRSTAAVALNTKLKSQLRGLQKTYGKQAIADLESPLEKAISLLRGMMVDPKCNEDQVKILSTVVSYLVSSNILQPDIDVQLKQGNVRLDIEQENWIFSELATKAQRKPRRKSNVAFSMVGTPPPMKPESTTSLTSKLSLHSNSQISPQSNARQLPALRRTSILDPTFARKIHNPKTWEELRVKPNAVTNTVAQWKEAPRWVQTPALLKRIYPFPPELTTFLDENINKWNFPIFEFQRLTQGRPLCILAMYILVKENLIATFDLNFDRVIKYLAKIEDGYRENVVYHNQCHAADVLQTVYFLCVCTNIKIYFGDLDLLAAFLSASAHDFDHPGFNNNYLMYTGDAMAILYNDKSILENHHLSASFDVLLNEDTFFLQSFSKEKWILFRESMIEMILATDLALHFSILSNLKSKLAGDDFDPIDKKEDKLLLLKIAIKCADVSHPTKDFALHERWSKLILEEFFLQGDAEKELGVPVSAFMDRETLKIPSSQSGFIDFVCQPLFDVVSKFIQLPGALETLATNRQFWVTEQKRENFHPTESTVENQAD